LSLKEQLRLFGFPDSFKVSIKESHAHDLFGNTLPVTVVTSIGRRLVSKVFLNKIYIEEQKLNLNEKQKRLFL
jgi:hypothetical protein